MIAIRELPHVLAIINAATIVVLLRAYSLIRARDREGHRRTMFVAIGLGVAFLAVYLVYHAFSGLAKFGGYGAIRPIYFTLLAVHVFMAFVVAVLVPRDLLQRAETALRHPQAVGSRRAAAMALCRGFWSCRIRDGDPPLSDERQLTTSSVIASAAKQSRGTDRNA